MVEGGRRFDFKLCLGSGGFGEVYLASMASASGVETEVAVKMLHDGLDPRSQAVQRLRDEGRMLGSLNHPSVLKVHDLVLLEGRVALVMEYVPGLDLEQCVELTPPIGLRAGLEVIGLVADALHEAFDSNGPDGKPLRLVHRDIKPPNIRVGRHGEVKVLDFGIAKASDARREAKTQTSVMMGSPWYMAPERFDGKNDGTPADVYALGCTLYEVAAHGGRLFSEVSSREHFLLALDPAAHDAHVKALLGPLDIPPDVRWLLDRMLAFEPSERPTNLEVSERAEVLAEAVPGETLRRWCKSLDWPDVPPAEGSFVGRVVTEARLSSSMSSPMGLTTPVEFSDLPAVPDPSDTGFPRGRLPDRSLPTFDGGEMEDARDTMREAREVENQVARRPIEPISRRRPATPPRPRGRHGPVSTRRPVPMVNHFIMPGVLAVVALTVVSVFGFFFFLCLGILAV